MASSEGIRIIETGYSQLTCADHWKVNFCFKVSGYQLGAKKATRLPN